MSGIQAIFAHRTKHPIVLQIKQLLQNLTHKVSLGHVSAHIGFEGNERADALAKAATAKPNIDFKLPVPPSHIRRDLKERFMSEWQVHWDTVPKGEHTYFLIPKVSRLMYNPSPPITAFLTGQGPFKAHLIKHHCASSPLCECGEEGTTAHAYYHCTLTALWYFKHPD